MINPFIEACKEYIDRYILGDREDEIFDKTLLEELRNYKPEGYMEPENNKYFTPNIEDIRVGYECEISHFKNRFIKLEGGIKDYHFSEIISGQAIIRVPYLTKEQIESRGWIYRGHISGDNSRGLLNCIKNNTEDIYSLYYDEEKHLLTMNGFNNLRFYGECKDINTFDYIMKLLKILNDKIKEG